MKIWWLLAAGLLLAVVGCSDVTPVGPDAAPRPQHLRTPIVLQVMRVQPPATAGGCAVGYTAVSGETSPGPCYQKTGLPVTITDAAVAIGHGGQSTYSLEIDLPAAERSMLTSVTTTAHNLRGGGLAVTIAGRIWGSIPMVTRPITGGQFQIFPLTMNQAVQLQRMLT
jgi:hypothetical protein